MGDEMERPSGDPPSRAQSMQEVYNSPQRASPGAHSTSSPQQTPAASAPHLPPIQNFDGHSMQSQQQFIAVPMNGGQMPQYHAHPPPYPAVHFPYQNGAIQPPTMPSNVGANGMMRFAIPPQQMVANMAGSRAKPQKDIKRRTKTGCLTCRKRRIKCDETHPSCRNCAKSKRECLGYDPIFKPQPGPALIQPAPPAAHISNSASTPTQSQYSTPHSYPAAGGAFVPTPHSAQSVDGGLEYGPSLDPALASGEMASNGYALAPTRNGKPPDA